MDWLYLGLISLGAFSTINILDRKFLGELKIHPVVFPAIATSLGTVFTFLFTLILVGVPHELPREVLYFGVISGIIDFASASFFYYSLSKAPLSKVIALDRIKIVTSLAIAVLFFHEQFYWIWVPGIFLIALGNILFIQKRGEWNKKWERGALYMFLAGLIGGFAIIPEKMGVEVGLPVLIALISSFTRSTGYVGSALIFHRQHFSHFWKHLKQFKWGSTLLFRSFCSASGWTAFYYALDFGLISKVTPLLQLRPVTSVILAIIFLSERETKLRIFGTILITLGALLIIF
jgi:transporter family protein